MADRAVWRRSFTRNVVQPLEAALLYVLHAVLKALPIDVASAVGGFVARAIGPQLGLSRRARRTPATVTPTFARS